MKNKSKKNLIKNLKEEIIMEDNNVNVNEETIEEVVNNDTEVSENINESIENTQENVETNNEEVTEDVKEDEVTEEVTEDSTEEQNNIEEDKNIATGKIDGCTLLNVRREPSIESDVVRVVDVNSILTIDKNDTNEDYYKVEVDDIHGYCTKKFVKIV